MNEFWNKYRVYQLQSLIYDIGGFMTASGDISPSGVENDILQIEVFKPNDNFTEELALEVLQNIIYEKVPAEKVHFKYYQNKHT